MTMSDKLLFSIQAGIGSVINDVIWYCIAAGLLTLLFQLLFRRVMARRKIIQRFASLNQIGVEVVRSLRSIAVFGGVTTLIVYLALHGYTRLYRNIDEYGAAWFVVSIFVAVIIHDTYFYWTHRLMHDPRVFKKLHRTHHLSTNPTPWAAYSFSTGEALVQAGIGPLLVFTIPMHGLAFLLFMTWQIAFNVFGHCGYEIFPKWFLHSWAGQLLNTPTHHALHHQKIRGNYGLYFNIWDRLMGTNHRDYPSRFERATRTS